MTVPFASCRTWQPVSGSPEALIADERPERVRVTVPGGGRVTLRSPIVVNDSIVGAVPADEAGLLGAPRPGVPTASVEAVEVASVSRSRSVALGVGIVALALGWARVAGSSNSGEPEVEEPVLKGPPAPAGGLTIVWRIGR